MSNNLDFCTPQRICRIRNKWATTRDGDHNLLEVALKKMRFAHFDAILGDTNKQPC
jgi:hypothetical protein